MPRLHTHISLTGQHLTYVEPSGALAKFLRQLEDMLNDATVTADAMTGFAYSPANPILDHEIFPERGPITKKVLADPHYPVMQDMLARKRAAESGLDVEKLAATHTVSVADAAAQLGMDSSALRKAIYGRRIRAWIRDGQLYLTPESVRSFEPGGQGPYLKPTERRRKAQAKRKRREQA